MTKALVYFTNFANSLGGSEYLPLLFVSELQRRGCDVTLALNWTSNIEVAMRLSGIQIDLQKLKVEYVKPKSRFLQRLDAIIPFCRTRALKRLAKKSDICISTANMVDFGKPAHHFVYLMRHFGDNAFIDYFMHNKQLSGIAKVKRNARTFLAEIVLRPLLGLRSTRKILSDPREHIYPNSCYVEKTMLDFYGRFNSTMFYPPTTFDINPCIDFDRDPRLVVCIGRISSEKHIEDIIDIVERSRQYSHLDIKLLIAGSLTPQTSYISHIMGIASQRTWVELAGAVYEDTKERLLMSGTYAVHARRDEEFGISVTEYLKAGLIPIVPNEGGSMEVVNSAALTYDTNDNAAKILTRLMNDESLRIRERKHCMKRANLFSRDAYLKRQHALLDKIMSP